MRVSLLAAVSVDGRIAESHDQIADWTSKEDKRFFVSKTKEAGVLVMGRKTYETIGKPLPGRLNVIMTRDPSKFDDIKGTLRYTSDAPRELLDKLTEEGFKEVVIAGGAQIYSMFVREELITDLFLTIEPVLFGVGVPLVDGVSSMKLNLESVDRLGEQAVLLHYTVL